MRAAGEPGRERGDHGDAGRREERRQGSERGQALVDQERDVREQEVERGAAAVAEHRVEDVSERPAADEEDERLVLVRRPDGQAEEQEQPGGRRDRPHGESDSVTRPRRDPRTGAGRVGTPPGRVPVAARAPC